MTQPERGAAPRAGTSFRFLMVALVLGLALPFLLVTGLAVWRMVAAEQARFEIQLLSTARALALAVDRDLGEARTRLEVMAAAPALQEGPAEVNRQFAGQMPDGAYLLLFDAAANVVWNSTRPDAPPVRSRSNVEFVAQVLRDGQTRVSNLFIGMNTGQPRLLVGRAVSIGGVPHVLALGMGNGRLRGLLEAQRIPPEWTTAILDPALRVTARSRREDEFLGQPALPALRAVLETADEGVVRGIRTMDGMRSVVGISRAAGSRFSVAIAAPLPPGWRAMLDGAGPALLAGLALLLSGLAVAILMARHLSRALQRLADPGGAAGGCGIAEVEAAAHRLSQAAEARDEATGALARNEERLRLTLEAFGGGAYDLDALAGRVHRSAGLLRLLGETRDEPTPGWWAARLHPEDLPAWQAARARMAEGTDRFQELRYRVRHADGGWRHVWDRTLALRDASGTLRRLVGCLLDVTAEAEARAARELLAREMDHRVKNSFALVTGLVSAAAAEHPEAQPFADTLRERLRALATAHDLARQGGRTPTLRALLGRLARPYGDAVRLEGEDVELPAEEVQPLALVVHEWLTNSVKHGALSRPGGRLALHVATRDGRALLHWREQGGPPAPPPAQRGFGAMLVEATISAQLGGEVIEDWTQDGLRLTLSWPAGAVAAPA